VSLAILARTLSVVRYRAGTAEDDSCRYRYNGIQVRYIIEQGTCTAVPVRVGSLSDQRNSKQSHQICHSHIMIHAQEDALFLAAFPPPTLLYNRQIEGHYGITGEYRIQDLACTVHRVVSSTRSM
jgi:hypothetical protein